MIGPLSLALGLALATAEGAPGGAEAEFRFAALPNISYASDIGLTLGAAAFLYRTSQLPARYDRLSVAASYATRGPRMVQLQLEYPQLGPSAWGGSLDLRFANDNREPYWGEGSALGGLTVPPGAGSPPEPYRFHDRRAFVSATLRPARAPAWSPYGRVRVLAVDVLEPSALLAAAQPPGSGGGVVALAELGLLLDTRDREVGTRRGLHASLSAFAAPPLGQLLAGSFVGANATGSWFLPVGSRATLAVHLLLDLKLGTVPFYERTSYEGIAYGGGLGGAGTLRGVARLRYAGEEKALSTAELRTALLDVRFGARLLQLGLSGGVDAGAARQRGYAVQGALCGFAGLRALWDEAVVLRVEVGYAGMGGAAIYVVTGEQF